MKQQGRVNTFLPMLPACQGHRLSCRHAHVTITAPVVFGEGIDRFHPRLGRNEGLEENTSLFTRHTNVLMC